MLELLGFIALVALIFGVSLYTAAGMIIKVILWIIGIMFGLYILSSLGAARIKKISAIGLSAIAILCFFLALDESPDKHWQSSYDLCQHFNSNRGHYEVDYYGNRVWVRDNQEDCNATADESKKVSQNKKDSYYGVALMFGAIATLLFVNNQSNNPDRRPENKK